MQFRAGRAACLGPRAHDQVDGRKGMLVQPERFPDDAADAVALHGIARGAHGNCHAEASAMLIVAAHCHREESVTKAPAARIRGVELRLPPQTPVRRKCEPVHSRRAEPARGADSAHLRRSVRGERTAENWQPRNRSLFPEPVKGSASGVPWRGGEPAPCGRSGSPCVPGTHAYACGAVCLADRYASFQGLQGIRGFQKRGGKAKPLSTKVSIFLGTAKPLALALEGIDSAALSPSN